MLAAQKTKFGSRTAVLGLQMITLNRVRADSVLANVERLLARSTKDVRGTASAMQFSCQTSISLKT